MGSKSCLKNEGKFFTFVLQLAITAKQWILYAATITMLITVEIDKDIIHYHAPIKKRLAKELRTVSFSSPSPGPNGMRYFRL